MSHSLVPCLYSSGSMFLVTESMCPILCTSSHASFSLFLVLRSLFCYPSPMFLLPVLWSCSELLFPCFLFHFLGFMLGVPSSTLLFFCYPFLCYRFHVLYSSMSELPCCMLHISCYFVTFSTILTNILEEGISLCTEEFMFNFICSML